MKILFTFGLNCLLFFTVLSAFGQAKSVKLDTIYYLLDTTSVPVKDRMFTAQTEWPAKGYSLDCRCYPNGLDITLAYDARNPREKKISLGEFKKIKTVSIVELIDIAMKCLPPADPTKYKFGIIEPDGENMRIIYMMLGRPYESRPVE